MNTATEPTLEQVMWFLNDLSIEMGASYALPDHETFPDFPNLQALWSKDRDEPTWALLAKSYVSIEDTRHQDRIDELIARALKHCAVIPHDSNVTLSVLDLAHRVFPYGITGDLARVFLVRAYASYSEPPLQFSIIQRLEHWGIGCMLTEAEQLQIEQNLADSRELQAIASHAVTLFHTYVRDWCHTI